MDSRDEERSGAADGERERERERESESVGTDL
jgi:hypothetical protein